MRVYLPFDDGSSVAFDGSGFTVHRRPMDIDADLEDPVSCKAQEAWQRDWKSVARALESAWRRQHEARRKNRAKQVYNNAKSPRGDGRTQ